ncbi:MAG: hypothetical protein MPN21_02725 [Thermoanaerobaculia bacterium]|nr:hypothetical protein [Thermoanaerobaculia bacterium]
MDPDLPFERLQEQRLVKRMVAGDRAAFDDFVARYTPALVRYAHTHLAG